MQTSATNLKHIARDGRGELTVTQLLELQSTFGIPHFQRGSVWNTDSIARLLESVFYGTPCGSILLWAPLHPEREGIPLVHGERPEYMLIDGQQRVRSLIKVFASPSQATGGDEEDDATIADLPGGGKHLWCINLARIKELEGMILPDFIDYPLFMYLQDPRTTRSRYRYDLVPLQVLLSPGTDMGSWGDIRALGSKENILADTLAALDLPRLCRQMLQQPFDVKVFTETPRRYQLAEVVHMYNRINSAGIRVEAEERAYAALAGVYPGIGTWLQDLFHFVEGTNGSANDPLHLRDDGLRRKKEARFGFKMFMRVLLQAYNYHKSSSFGSSSLSFENLMHFAEEIASNDRGAKVDRVFADAAFAVQTAVRVLREVLHCDDLRFVPDAMSLQPLFLLMFKYFSPREDQATASYDEYREVLGFVILDMMLEQVAPENVRQILQEIDGSSSLHQCVTAIKRHWPVSRKGLLTSLRKTSTVQARYTLVLYWLLRRNGARDFSYERQFPGDTECIAELRRNVPEGPIDASFIPERQHLIPIEVLKGCYADLRKKGSRMSDHRSNNIGNITYISSALNSFDGGVGARPLVLAGEDKENLQSHYLLGSRGAVLAGYDAVLRASADQQKALFEQWIEKRAELVCDGMISWLTELRDAPCPQARIEPRERELSEAYEDAVRRFGLDDELEDAAIACIERTTAFQLRAHKGVFENSAKRFSIGFENKQHKRDIVVFRLSMTPDRMELDLSRAPESMSALAEQAKITIPTGKAIISWTRGSKTEEADRALMLIVLGAMTGP